MQSDLWLFCLVPAAHTCIHRHTMRNWPAATSCRLTSLTNAHLFLTLFSCTLHITLCVCFHLQYMAWAELFIASALNPRASFMGHLCGILAGKSRLLPGCSCVLCISCC